jgi:methylmalonyl-CoA mutase
LTARRLDKDVPNLLNEFADEVTDSVKQVSRDPLDSVTLHRSELCGDDLVTKTSNGERRLPLSRRSPSGTEVCRIALPRANTEGDLFRGLYFQNQPGHFPYTTEVFLIKHKNEDLARKFAKASHHIRTHRRFDFFSEDHASAELSTAFHSVTLYGCDSDTPLDIDGKIGTSSVSSGTLDDMKVICACFYRCDTTTSMSRIDNDDLNEVELGVAA